MHVYASKDICVVDILLQGAWQTRWHAAAARRGSIHNTEVKEAQENHHAAAAARYKT